MVSFELDKEIQKDVQSSKLTIFLILFTNMTLSILLILVVCRTRVL